MVGAQRAINDSMSLGVKTGARPEDNGVSLDFDLTRHLRLQGGVDATGGSTVGVGRPVRVLTARRRHSDF